MRYLIIVLAVFASILTGPRAGAETICTLITDERAEELHQTGDCDSRVTPASTFKIALALMGFDAGILQDAQTPQLPFREGYVDWGGANWRQATDPQRWMRYSVVWFSQQITPDLGVMRLTNYAASFGYGNADFSGDPGQNNGLERAWIASSLKISPREQVTFLSRMIRYELPVSVQSVDRVVEIMTFNDTSDGWRIWGKTGAAYPRTDAGGFDRNKGRGWFVGWAKRGGSTLVFAHLLQDSRRHDVSPGLRARSAFLGGFDDLVARVVK